MLLEDFRNNGPRRFSKVSKQLKEAYGIHIPEDVPYYKLEQLKSDLAEANEDLKMRGAVANTSVELARNMLMIECIETLIAKKEYRELRENYNTSPRYQTVVAGLADHVIRLVSEFGDDFEDACDQAMKEYRSSKWRWPDHVVRHDCATKAKEQLEIEEMGMGMGECGSSPMLSSFMEPDEVDSARAFVVVPGAKLSGPARHKLHNYYSDQGEMPGEDNDLNDWYFERLLRDFSQDVNEGKAQFDIDHGGTTTFSKVKPKIKPAKMGRKATYQIDPEGQEQMGDYTKAMRSRLKQEAKAEFDVDHGGTETFSKVKPKIKPAKMGRKATYQIDTGGEEQMGDYTKSMRQRLQRKDR